MGNPRARYTLEFKLEAVRMVIFQRTADSLQTQSRLLSTCDTD